MDVKTALQYADISKGNQGLYERVSRVLAKEHTRITAAVKMAPIQDMTLPNGSKVKVALVMVDETGKVK